MANTIPPSLYSRSLTWLRQQTYPSKANNEHSNTAVKWVAKQTKATNISIVSGIAWLGTYLAGYFARDSDNKFLKLLIRGIRWVSGIAGIVIPFANIGTNGVAQFDIKEKIINSIAKDLDVTNFDLEKLEVPANYASYEDYNQDNACNLIANLLEDCIEGTLKLDEPSKESLRRILILNWKVPITASGTGIQGTKIPQTSRTKSYRLGMHNTILGTLKENNSNDPLFLKTTITKVPEDLKLKATDLRTALLNAYTAEVELEKTNTYQYDKDVVLKIEEILHISGDSIPDEMPKWLWNAAAKMQRAVTEQNQARLGKFKEWAKMVSSSCEARVYSNTKLEEIFNKFSQSQKENISLVHKLYSNECYSSASELRQQSQSLIALLELDSESWHTYKDSDRNLFLLKYLEAILEKEIRIESQDGKWEGKLRFNLESDCLEKIIDHCRSIIHDDYHLYEPKRDPDFFMNPRPNTLPGQALIIHHKLRSNCFSDGACLDLYGLKDLALRTCTGVIYPARDGGHMLNGFLLSGPSGTGKSVFAKALANQLAVPLFEINPHRISTDENGNVLIDKIFIGTVLHRLKANSPCILLIDKPEKILKPRECDNGYNSSLHEGENLTGLFLTDLQDFREHRIIPILTTSELQLSQEVIEGLDEKGYSSKAELELYKHISSAAIRCGRIDCKIFLFHKPLDDKQKEDLARHFLRPYIKSGKAKEVEDYNQLAQLLDDCTPHDIECVLVGMFNSLKEGEEKIDVTAKLESRRKVEASLVESERRESIQVIITGLTLFKSKTLEGATLNYNEITKASSGLTDEQIHKALQEYTPKILTQENILAAFEQVRKLGS